MNAAHVLGIALLVGAILPLDLKLAGGWRHVPAADLLAVLRPCAMVGLLLAVATGAVLFTVNPAEYLSNPAFRLKILLLLAALANVILIERSLALRRVAAGEASPALLRLGAAVSAVLWIAVLIAGRWIGFL